jgi:hypothetical protein
MKKLALGMLFLGLTNLGYSQASDEHLWKINLDGPSEAKVINKDYQHKVQYGSFSSKVIQLENIVARFDYTKSTFSKASVNHLTFKKGKDFIKATFDQNGSILRTYEKFRNIGIPGDVRTRLYKDYPGWTMTSNTYVVSYGPKMEVKKIYNIGLEKANLQKRVRYVSGKNTL